jgi:tRNA A-37 threonylcarbamoyl transferase component Bud32
MALEDVGGYSLRRGLGSGSVGAVWLVRDLGSGRHAVLKRIPAASVPAAEEFRRDLALARGVDHPHLARLLEVRQTEREWLLFSQYVAAGTLTGLLQRRGPLSLGELVTLISPLAQALGALHRAGLTHGHLGAGDVMFDADGRPVVTDAGLRLLIPTAGVAPADDLAALGALALEAGGDQQTFSPALFDGDGEEVGQRVLRLATPQPVNLGFGDDARVGAPAPLTDGSEGSARPARFGSASAGGSSRGRKGRRTGRTDRSPEPGNQATGDVSFQPGSQSAGPADAGGTAARPTVPRPGRRTGLFGGRTAKSRGRGRSGGRAARTPSQTGTNGGRFGVTEGRPVGVMEGRPIGVREGGQSGVAAQRGFLRSKRSTYGVLAMVGLAVVVVFGIGLAALGVLGGSGSDPASAADGGSGGQTASPRSGRSVGVVTPGEPDGSPSLPPATTAAEEGRWLGTLQALDLQRSQTFSTLDPVGLDAIYVPGSSPWQADRSLLASYRDRQVRIDGLKMQIDKLAVERPGAGTVVLRVVDRLIAGAAVDNAGRRTPLPAGTPTARLIILTGNGDAWRISGIVTA